MAVSDQLNKVSARAKQAEDHAFATHDKAAAELKSEVEMARLASQEQAERLRARIDSQRDIVGGLWSDTQNAWTQHLSVTHRSIDRRERVIDLRVAERNAQDAEENAAFAIEYACAAIEEAEYAVLGAVLARAEADEMARPRTLR